MTSFHVFWKDWKNQTIIILWRMVSIKTWQSYWMMSRIKMRTSKCWRQTLWFPTIRLAEWRLSILYETELATTCMTRSNFIRYLILVLAIGTWFVCFHNNSNTTLSCSSSIKCPYTGCSNKKVTINDVEEDHRMKILIENAKRQQW